MRTAFVLAVAFATAVSVSACRKPATSGATNATATGAASSSDASAATAPSGGGGALANSDMPHRKPGLWKMHMVNSAMPRPVDYAECVGPETDKVDWTGRAADHHCNPNFSRGLDGSIHGTATCSMGRGMSMAMEVRVAGDFGNHYTVHIDNTMSGAPLAQLNGKHSMDIDAVWSGPCTPGSHGMQAGQ